MTQRACCGRGCSRFELCDLAEPLHSVFEQRGPPSQAKTRPPDWAELAGAYSRLLGVDLIFSWA